MLEESDFFAILETLVRHETRFIVVGGIAAVLHGAPVMTEDIDILFDPRPDNLHRPLAALCQRP